MTSTVSNSRLQSLGAVSPIDGRYFSQTKQLSEYFSEFGLIKHRLYVEVEYLIFLADTAEVIALTTAQRKKLRRLFEAFDQTQVTHIKQIESNIHHDVKAIEYYLREKMAELDISGGEYIHFGLTSEDVNNLAYGLSLREGLDAVVIPSLTRVCTELLQLSQEYKDTSMLARTHGQPAVPTTFGKEMLVFMHRVVAELTTLSQLPIQGKLTGAVGNWNAHYLAYPKLDWIELSKKFVSSLGLEPTIVTTQILPTDSYIKVFQSLHLMNSILIGLTQDMWRYISDGYVRQALDSGTVGSSTMPQKVNPIDFENSEGNLGMANSNLEFYIQKLPISRLQRDLSDSTIKRNFGATFGYCLLGYASLARGLKKIAPDPEIMQKELERHFEVFAEGAQTLLRKSGDVQAYERFKSVTQGKQLTESSWAHIVTQLEIDSLLEEQLLDLTPLTYLGLASRVVEEEIPKLEEQLKKIQTQVSDRQSRDQAVQNQQKEPNVRQKHAAGTKKSSKK